MTRPADAPPAARYDRISAAYDLIADPAEHHARERGLDLLDARPGESLLEIGAGTGRALIGLARAVGPYGLVCALDASAGMLRLACQRLSSDRRQVHVQQGDARSLPYLAATFDAAFMSFTLELFDTPDIEVVLTEIQRVLRPTGRVAIVCLAAETEPGVVAQAYGWLHRRYPHLVDCRPIDVLRHIERGGFRVTRTERMNLWGLPVAVVSAKRVGSLDLG